MCIVYTYLLLLFQGSKSQKVIDSGCSFVPMSSSSRSHHTLIVHAWQAILENGLVVGGLRSVEKCCRIRVFYSTYHILCSGVRVGARKVEPSLEDLVGAHGIASDTLSVDSILDKVRLTFCRSCHML